MIGGCKPVEEKMQAPLVLLHRGGWKLNAPPPHHHSSSSTSSSSFFPLQLNDSRSQPGPGGAVGSFPPVREGFPCERAVRTTTTTTTAARRINKQTSVREAHQEGRQTHIEREREGRRKKCTQYTMVLPGAAAIALRQTLRETRLVSRLLFFLLDSCGANGNVHEASCAEAAANGRMWNAELLLDPRGNVRLASSSHTAATARRC